MLQKCILLSMTDLDSLHYIHAWSVNFNFILLNLCKKKAVSNLHSLRAFGI